MAYRGFLCGISFVKIYKKVGGWKGGERELEGREKILSETTVAQENLKLYNIFTFHAILQLPIQSILMHSQISRNREVI